MAGQGRGRDLFSGIDLKMCLLKISQTLEEPRLPAGVLKDRKEKPSHGQVLELLELDLDDVEIGGSIQTKDSSEPGAISFQSVLSMKAKEILPKDMVIKRLMRTRKNLKKQQMTGLMINLMGIMKHLKVDPFKL